MKHLPLHKPVSLALSLTLLVSLVGLTGFTGIPGTADHHHGSVAVYPVLDRNIDRNHLENFTDTLIARQLDEFHIAGAIVAIVKNGKIALSKGYGYANVEGQVPASPDETLFRIGSTSKLFTWTAVMQLVEQGKIDLYEDINTYLSDFQIPATYPEPITMWNLMTHTAGFEERFMGMLADRPEVMISVHDYLVNHMPARVCPVGIITAYSNYGTALAGYIIEIVTGMPFERYIETYLFEPLAMSHSTFRQPAPPGLQEKHANGYAYKGSFLVQPYQYITAASEGAMSTTAVDMAHFMLAHLQDGEFENQQILSPETIHKMHTRQFSNDQRLDGFALGFFQGEKNGQRFLEHAGKISGWNSSLVLLPEKNLGFFVAYNSDEGIAACPDFFQSFMDYYFQRNDSQYSFSPSSTSNLEIFVGDYRSSRTASQHLDRLGHFSGSMHGRVIIDEEGNLATDIKFTDYFVKQTFVPTQDPLVFHSIDGNDILIFHTNEDGKIEHLLFNSRPHYAFERISWFETPTFALYILGVCAAILLTTILFGLGRAIAGFFHKNRHSSVLSAARTARIWAWSLSAAFIALIGCICIFIFPNVMYPFPPLTSVILALILLTSILVVVPLRFTVLAWTRCYWSLAGRLHYTIINAALLGMVWLMYYWRLLGFRY